MIIDKYIRRQFKSPVTRKIYDKIANTFFSLIHSVRSRVDVTNIYHCCTHKTASQWFRSIFADPIIYQASGLLPYTYQRYLPDGADRRPLNERNFENYRFPRKAIITPLYVDWHSYRTIRKPEYYRTFFVLRDPRDLVVSWYFSMKDTHAVMTEQIAEWRSKLRALDKCEGLSFAIKEMNRTGQFTAQRSWVEHQDEDENVRIYRFEEIFGPRQFNIMKDLMQHLRIYIPDAVLRELLEKHSFERKRRRSGHYRKGKPGDWRNHLDPHHLKLLAELTDDIVGRLGYD